MESLSVSSYVDHGDFCTVSHDGVPQIIFKQLFNKFPMTRSLYPFDFETSYSSRSMNFHLLDSMSFPFALSFVYLIVIFGGRYLMKDRKAFDLKWPLAFWNIFLSAFSLMGALRLFPHLLSMVYFNGFEGSVCLATDISCGMGAVGLWKDLFIISKIPELLDTVFIVLKKKPLIFLHYYHHITVLLFVWYAGAEGSSIGMYFMSMNYVVHSVMYFYFFASGLGLWPRSISPIFITIMQLVQMFMGIIVNFSVMYYKGQGQACETSNDVVYWGLLMYLSYFLLFFKFLIQRFFSKKTVRPLNSNSKKTDIVSQTEEIKEKAE